MRDEAPQRRAIRQQDGEVIQPEQPGPRNRPDARTLVQHDQRLFLTLGAERRLPLFATQHPQAEHALVVVEGSAEIADLQPHGAKPCGVRQPVSGWRDAVVQSHRGKTADGQGAWRHS